jgi:hypothetical protein
MNLVSVNNFEQRMDGLELQVKHLANKQTIEGFENKGWALYEVPGQISNIDELKEVVEEGYEGSELMDGKRYLPLPLVQGATEDYGKVMQAVHNLKNPLCFFDLDIESVPEKFRPLPLKEMVGMGIYPTAKGVYHIDSIAFNGELALVIDKRNLAAHNAKKIPEGIQNPAIIVPYYNIPQVLEEQVNEYRAKKNLSNDGLYLVH